MLSCYYLILLVTFLPRNSEQLKLSSSDPKIVADSFLSILEVGQKWIKFKDLVDEEKDEVFQVVDRGFVFYSLFEVQIHCQAPYPVQWRMNNLQMDEPSFGIRTFTKRIGKLGKNIPDKWGFTAVLLLYTTQPFVNVNYTCQGLGSNRHRKASISVYTPVLGESVIAEAGKKFEINVDGKSLAVLPCRLAYLDSDNNIQILLQRKLEKEDLSFTWSLMTLNNSVVYDSRVGFSLIVKDLPGIVGDYRCLVNGTEAGEEEAVHFTISNTPKDKTDVDDLTPRKELQGSAAMWWKDGNQYEIFCCSNSEKPPTISVRNCGNPAQCSYVKFFLSRVQKQTRFRLLHPSGNNQGFPTRNCSRYFVYNPIFTIKCKGEGINVLETYHYTFKNPGVPELKDRGGNYAHFNLSTEIDFLPASMPTTIGNEERMIKMAYFKSMKVKQGNGNNKRRKVIVQDPSGRPDDFMYTGSTVTFRCYYSTYVFATGGYWVVKWKTGDSKMFPGGGTAQNILSRTMKLERELESVACGVSVLNTSEWKFRETKVSVKDPVAPSFKVKEEEIVWKLRSKNVSLECDLSGLPVSVNATWRKDGKEILLEHSKLMRIVQTGLTSVLVIPEVSHEMHGEYSCKTKNVVGRAVKVFHVYVEEENSATGWTILGVIISLAVIGGVTFVVWKYGLDNVKKIFVKKLS